MSFCTQEQVRNCNKKLRKETEVATADIQDRISEADDTVIVDLSSMFSEAELLALGASSKSLNLLSKWKAVELTLAFVYGAAREVDTISDVDYWRIKYNALLKKVLNGVTLVEADTDTSPINYPKIGPSVSGNAKFYPRKGVEGFTPDGAKTDIKDDTVK